jgi:hypothetical protein
LGCFNAVIIWFEILDIGSNDWAVLMQLLFGLKILDIGSNDWAVLMQLLFGLRLWILVVIIGLF